MNSTVYRVVFTAELSGESYIGSIAERVGYKDGKEVWSAYVEIIQGYSTFDSVPTILGIAYPGLKDIAPMFAEDPYSGQRIEL